MFEEDKMFMDKCSSLFTSEASVTNQKNVYQLNQKNKELSMAFFEIETLDVLDLLKS